MRFSILPFSSDHLESAAALLAARHRRDRVPTPGLTPEFEDPAATLPVLRAALDEDGTRGVVALRDRQVAGFMLGAPVLGSPARAFAGFMQPRAAAIPYAGHAMDLDDATALYPCLYAALARQWVEQGLTGHNVTVPTSPDAMEPWSDLGFGRFIALGARATSPMPEQAPRLGTDVEVRRATVENEYAIQALMTEFFRTFADPPIFVPFLPETVTGRRGFVEKHLADTASSWWLAFSGDRLVGLHLFVEPTSPHWDLSPLEAPRRAVYLHIAYTVPEARGTGIGAALVERTMAWAREAGYESCAVHWVTASRAAQFWRGCGFRPLTYWLRRDVDERMPWARGE